MEYTVAIAKTLDALTADVNARLKRGWLLRGDIIFLPERELPSGPFELRRYAAGGFAQAMIRIETGIIEEGRILRSEQ